MRKINIIIIQILALTVLAKSGFCLSEKDIGIILEPGKYESIRIYCQNGGKKVELKVKGEIFTEPTLFKKSDNGMFILFIDSVDYNEFDSYLYLFDIKQNKLKRLLMRNIASKHVRKIEWFDTHSFMIRISSDKTYYNYVLGNYGPFVDGTYIVKFSGDFQVEIMQKIAR